MVEVRVLGPVAVADGATIEAVGARRLRALLAALALAGGGVVSTDSLAEALWGDDPPDGVRGTLQSYVSRLRASLGSEAIGFEPGGYCLRVPTDVGTVEELARRGRALAERDPAAAAGCFDVALAQWRGPALGDLADDAWFLPDIARLAELHRSLVDDRIEAHIRAGRAATVVTDVERAAAAEPLRERTQLLRIETLAATGRTVEALRAANDYRQRLAEETGLDSGPSLAALEQQLLLGAATAPAPPATRRSASLPRPGSLVGRDDELDRLGRAIATERVVTVLGAGGIGKTRLVSELLHRARPKSAVVELAGAGEEDVPGAIAAALGLAGATTDPVGAAAEMLSVSPVLLVLDNAEHVTAAVRASMRRLLDGAPGVRMLVTSRVRLALPEEHVLALGPLPCRAPDAAAVTLFVERLRRGTGGRDISAAELADAQVVCEKVEGVPLAVELAAVRAAALGTSALVRGLDDVLDLGTSGGAASVRHETLRSVVAWSYELLSAPDRELLDRISIFESDVTLDAVEALAAAGGTTSPAEGLARLVDASLVSALSDGRLVLLDTVRRFARERLALRPWSEDVRVAHAEWVATLLDEVAAGVAGSRDVAAVVRLRRHMDDVRAALRTALASGDRELCERLARSVSTMTVYRPHGELLAWTRRAADELRPAGPAVRSAAARAAYLQGDLDRAKASAAGLDTAVAHHARAVVALYEGAHDHALEAFATAAEAGDVDLACRLDAQAGIALTHCYKGAVDAGRAALDALRLLSESTGAETYGAFADYIAGELALATNEDRVAVELLRAAVVRARAVHADFIVGVASTALLSALVRVGDVDAALGTAVDLIDHWWGNATWTQQWTTLRLASAVLDAAGRPDVALLVLEAAKLDRAAPAVVGDDAAQLDARHARLTQTLGATTAATVAEVATQLPRATVVQRVRQVLTELAAGASGAPATDAVTG